jgi:hypothetical protein
MIGANSPEVNGPSKPPLILEWEAPANCAQQSDIIEEIRKVLGASRGATLPSGLSAKGVIAPSNERFKLELTVRTRQSERTRVIVADDCGSLGKAAAVVLGLLIQRVQDSGGELSESDLATNFASEPTPHEPIPEHQVEKPLDTSESEKAPLKERKPPTDDTLSRRRWHVLLMPTLTIDYLTLPSESFGLGVALGASYDQWRTFLLSTYWRSQQLKRGGIEPYDAQFERVSFEAWGCRSWSWGSFDLSPCALAVLDLIQGSASGDRFTTEGKNVPLGAIGTGGIARWNVSKHWGLFVAATGRIAVFRTDFVVKAMMATDRTHVVPWGTVATSIGTEVVF